MKYELKSLRQPSTHNLTKETVMNHKISQPITPQEKTQTPSAPSNSGQTDTKEILFLAGGLIILVLGLGGLFTFSMDEPLPATASQKSAEAVSTFKMTEAITTATPSSATPISHESASPFATDPSVQLVASSPALDQAIDTDVYFEFNRWALSEGAKSLLKTQVETQGVEWTGMLRIDGHTDAQGNDSYNRALGLKRAEAVKTYLVSIGIPEDTIQVQSFGKDGAVCQDQTPDCFEHNRRAHVAFLSQPTSQQDDTLLSMTPDALEDSTPEASSPMLDSPSIEDSKDEMFVQQENPAELVAVDPLVSAESLP
jgi:peptidoglycan-associated lipoprotein